MQFLHIPDIAESLVYTVFGLYMCETKAAASIFNCSIPEAWI